MPIHNLGYRDWEGERQSGGTRWSVIANVGIRRAWQSAWLRRIVVVTWAPPLIFAVAIFFFERYVASEPSMFDPGLASLIIGDDVFSEVENELRRAEVQQAVQAGTAYAEENFENPSQRAARIIRPLAWKGMLLQLQKMQSGAMILVIGLIAPPLISQDIRSRAFLLYFSRPLTRLQYIFGKFCTVASFLFLTITLPQILLYLFAVLLSPDISVVADTWDMPVRAILSSLAMITPMTLLAMMISSLTIETRFATFGWFTVWVSGAVTAMVFVVAQEADSLLARCAFFWMLFRDISMVILDVGSKRPVSDVATQFCVVLGIAVISFTVVLRKVSAPMKA